MEEAENTGEGKTEARSQGGRGSTRLRRQGGGTAGPAPQATLRLKASVSVYRCAGLSSYHPAFPDGISPQHWGHGKYHTMTKHSTVTSPDSLTLCLLPSTDSGRVRPRLASHPSFPPPALPGPHPQLTLEKGQDGDAGHPAPRITSGFLSLQPVSYLFSPFYSSHARDGAHSFTPAGQVLSL